MAVSDDEKDIIMSAESINIEVWKLNLDSSGYSFIEAIDVSSHKIVDVDLSVDKSHMTVIENGNKIMVYRKCAV